MRLFGLSLLTLAILCATGVGPAAADGPAAGVGLVDPNGAGSALWLTANVRRAAGDHVVIEPEAGYWSRKDSSPGVDNSISDASLGVNVLYRICGKSLRSATRVFAGAGVGVHLVQSKAAVAGYDDVEETEVKQGMHLLATADHRIGGALRVFISVRSDLVADLYQSKIYGGIRLGN
jgi:hypothetical protein